MTQSLMSFMSTSTPRRAPPSTARPSLVLRHPAAHFAQNLNEPDIALNAFFMLSPGTTTLPAVTAAAPKK